MESRQVWRQVFVVCVAIGMGVWSWMSGSAVRQGPQQAHAKRAKRTKRVKRVRRCVRYAKRRRCYRRCLRRRGRRCIRRSRKRLCRRRCLRWKRMVVNRTKKTGKAKPEFRRIPITPSMPRRDRAIAGVQNYYQEVQTLCADFQQIFRYARISRPQKAKGRFYFRKPGKMRMYYTHPEPKDFIYNGIMRTLWVYFPDDQEVKVQYNQSLSQIAVAVPFLRGSGNLRTSFRIREYPKRSFGRRGDILLELTPKKPQTVLRKLYLAVDSNKYMIRETAYTDPAGNRNAFVFRKLRRNGKCNISNTMFRFKRPKGVEQIVIGR